MVLITDDTDIYIITPEFFPSTKAIQTPQERCLPAGEFLPQLCPHRHMLHCCL